MSARGWEWRAEWVRKLAWWGRPPQRHHQRKQEWLLQWQCYPRSLAWVASPDGRARAMRARPSQAELRQARGKPEQARQRVEPLRARCEPVSKGETRPRVQTQVQAQPQWVQVQAQAQARPVARADLHPQTCRQSPRPRNDPPASRREDWSTWAWTPSESRPWASRASARRISPARRRRGVWPAWTTAWALVPLLLGLGRQAASRPSAESRASAAPRRLSEWWA